MLTANSDGPYQATGTPRAWDHKYIAEDVPVGLMPIAAIGKAAGIPMTATQTLVEMAKLMTGNDYAATARSLAAMGLDGKDAAGIRRIVDQGFG